MGLWDIKERASAWDQGNLDHEIMITMSSWLNSFKRVCVCAPHKGQQLSWPIVLPGQGLSKPGAELDASRPQQLSPPHSSEVRGICLWPAWLFMWVLETWSPHAFRARTLAHWGIFTAPSLVFKGLAALNQWVGKNGNVREESVSSKSNSKKLHS